MLALLFVGMRAQILSKALATGGSAMLASTPSYLVAPDQREENSHKAALLYASNVIDTAQTMGVKKMS